MPHDPARIAEVRTWFAKATEDLRAAEHGFTAAPPLLATIVFHAQQAAEKALKGFLVWHDVAFRKTHDLAEIGQQVVGLDSSMDRMCRDAEHLTVYAWTFRYPGDADTPTAEEATEAMTVARALFAAILTRLPAEVRIG
jgi:HEPN domain-containing protein